MFYANQKQLQRYRMQVIKTQPLAFYAGTKPKPKVKTAYHKS